MPLNGHKVPVVLGFSNPDDYLRNPHFLGVIAGRVANRISGASFAIGADRFDLQMNEPPNQLHGGAGGLYRRNWMMQTDGPRAVRLRLVSPHGDQGFPGRVVVEVTISLSGFTVTYDMVARTDRETPINLAQHSYYNLMGQGDVLGHQVQINADRYTPLGRGGIPTGAIATLDGQSFDLRAPQSVAQAGLQLDMNYILSGDIAAKVHAPNGMGLQIRTDQPCLQLYTGGGLDAPYSGLCLEPQQYVNAVNIAAFPSILITPDRPYRQITKVQIAPIEVL